MARKRSLSAGKWSSSTPKLPGVTQPYHYVEEMELPAAERHLAQCAVDSRRMAREALRQISLQLLDRGIHLVGAAILLSSARPLPDLDEVLASHALIHTAEGEFFRQAFRAALKAWRFLLPASANANLTNARKSVRKLAAEVRTKIDGLGRSLGPPWTATKRRPRSPQPLSLPKLAATGLHSKGHTFHGSGS